MHSIIKKILIFITITSLSSCSEVRKSVTAWYDSGNTENVTGKRHFLDYNGIKLLLPNEFEKYSVAEYQKLTDSLLTTDQFLAEVNRIQQLQKMNGELYLFIDKQYAITLSAITTPYIPFSKRDAQQLFNQMANTQKIEARKRDIEVQKISAKFNGNSKFQLFKTEYGFKAQNNKTQWYTANYIISSNNKKIFLQLTSPFPVGFDPFINKIIF